MSHLAGAVAVVGVALHTFRRRIHSNCCSVGEDDFYRQDMREHQVVDLPWTPNGRNSASEYDQDQRDGYELHMLLSAVLAELMCVHIHGHRAVAAGKPTSASPNMPWSPELGLGLDRVRATVWCR